VTATSRLCPPLLALALALSPAVAAAQVDHVFIFCIDGVRASEGFDAPDGGGLAPLLDELAPLGSVLTFVENRALTTTLPAHQLMVTGNYADYDTLPPSGDRLYLHPRTPTLFESYRQQTGAAADSCWVVSNTPHLFDTHRSLVPGYGEPYAAERRVSLTGGDSDPWVWEQIDEVMADHTVDLMLVNLHETDRKGHSGEWGAYTGAMELASEDLVAFWDRLQGDPVYADRSALLVFTDHGRHLDGIEEGWLEHGDGCLGCRQTFLLALGPGIRAGYVGDDLASMIDVAPTVAHLMGLDFPHARGRVLAPILDDDDPFPGVGGDGGLAGALLGGQPARAVERFDPSLADDQGAHAVAVEVSADGGETWDDLGLPVDGELRHAPLLWGDGDVLLAGTLAFEPRTDAWITRLQRWSAEDGGWSTVLGEEMAGSSTPRGGLALVRLDDGLLLLENNARDRRIRAWTSDDLGRSWIEAPARGFAYDPQRFPRDLSATTATDGSLLVLFSANVAYQPTEYGPHDNTEVYRLRSVDGGASWGTAEPLSDDERPSIQPRMVAIGDPVHAVWADMASGVFQLHHALSLDDGETFDDARPLTVAELGAWEPALAGDGIRPWVAWSQAEGVDRTSIHLAAIDDGGLADERVLAQGDGLARAPSLTYLGDGAMLACWSAADEGEDWQTACSRETVAWYPAASAQGSVDPTELAAGGGIQRVVFTVETTLDGTSAGFDRISVRVPAPFEPAGSLELLVDETEPGYAGWTSDDTLWGQLEEAVGEDVDLRIEVALRTPLEPTGPLPFTVTLHNGENPYVTEVDGDLAVAAVGEAGDCQCRAGGAGGASGAVGLIAAALWLRRRR